MSSHHHKPGVARPGVLTRTASATMTAATVGLLVTLTPTPATADPAVPGDGPAAVQQLADLNYQAEVLTEKWHYARDQLNARRADLERARADVGAAAAAANRAREVQGQYREQVDRLTNASTAAAFPDSAAVAKPSAAAGHNAWFLASFATADRASIAL